MTRTSERESHVDSGVNGMNKYDIALRCESHVDFCTDSVHPTLRDSLFIRALEIEVALWHRKGLINTTIWIYNNNNNNNLSQPVTNLKPPKITSNTF